MGKKKAPLTRRHAARRIVGPSSNGLLLPIPGESSLSSSASASPTHASSLQPRLGLAGLSPPISSSSDDRAPKSRRKRQNSGDDEASEEEQVTMTLSELERWKQRVIFHVEDHFTNEQLKRIAEFGRVHASMVQEAKQHVAEMEEQMMRQVEQERMALRAQAEEFVEGTKKENEALRQQVGELETQVDGLQKQVDSLKQRVGALVADREKLVDGVEQQRNGEIGKQEQAPPRSDGDHEQREKVDGNVENLPTNSDQGDIPLGESNLPTKKLNGLSGHTLSANPTEPTPIQHHTDIEKDRHRELQQIPQLPPQQLSNSATAPSLTSSVSMDISDERSQLPHSCEEAPASGAK